MNSNSNDPQVKQLTIAQTLVILVTVAVWFATFQFKPHQSIFGLSILAAVILSLVAWKPGLVGVGDAKRSKSYLLSAISAWVVVYVLSAGPVTRYSPEAIEPFVYAFYSPVRYGLLKLPVFGRALEVYLNEWFISGDN